MLSGARIRQPNRWHGAFLTHTRLMAVGDAVLVAAAQLEPVELRTLDAIHVASARRSGGASPAFLNMTSDYCARPSSPAPSRSALIGLMRAGGLEFPRASRPNGT